MISTRGASSDRRGYPPHLIVADTPALWPVPTPRDLISVQARTRNCVPPRIQPAACLPRTKLAAISGIEDPTDQIAQVRRHNTSACSASRTGDYVPCDLAEIRGRACG